MGRITILFILAFGMIVSGCGGNKYTYPESFRARADGEFVSQTSTFKTSSNTYAADFGTIAVAENRNNNSSRLIYLPVIRIRSRSKNPLEPILALAGGPGMSNMKWMPLDSLLEGHDFVMVGYRGVDGSTVLSCPELVEALKAEDKLLSEEALKRISQAWRLSIDRLKAQGADWDGYTIPETIMDMEAVRRALQYERINLLSESYGTRIAYIYGLMYPGHIFRSVMISANPPGHFYWDPQKVDEQIEYYSRLWSKDSLMVRKSANLSATLRNVLRNLPKKWLFFSINPDKLRIITFPLLFHRYTAAMVFDAYVAAEHGDYSGIALLSLAFDYVLPSMFVWGDLASKAITADFDSTRMYNDETPRENSVLGSPLNTLLWGPLNYAQIPVKLIPQELRTARQSDVETLVLSGSIDFSTPAEYATNELLPHLPNGTQIVLPEYGHVNDIRTLRPNVTERIIVSYYNTGVADTSQIEYVPMDFSVTWGFPEIAKVMLGTGVVVGAALLAGIIFGVRAIW